MLRVEISVLEGDENAAATVKQSYGTFRLLGNSPAAPLIAASAQGRGNAQINPNPNGGGFGNPLERDPDSFSDSHLSPKLAATYQLDDAHSVYGQYAAGFRAGSVDLLQEKT